MPLPYRLAVALVLASLALAGCGRSATSSAQPTPATSTATPHAGPAASKQPASGLVEMTDDAKRSQLNEQFPLEYPVVAGDVVGVRAVSAHEFRYELRVAAPAEQVEAWHLQTLAARMFALTSRTAADDGTRNLVFSRGGVSYRISIADDGGSASRVAAIIQSGK